MGPNIQDKHQLSFLSLQPGIRKRQLWKLSVFRLPGDLIRLVGFIGWGPFIRLWLVNFLLVGGWTNPFQKYARQDGNHLPQFSGWILKKCLSCHHLVALRCAVTWSTRSSAAPRWVSLQHPAHPSMFRWGNVKKVTANEGFWSSRDVWEWSQDAAKWVGMYTIAVVDCENKNYANEVFCWVEVNLFQKVIGFCVLWLCTWKISRRGSWTCLVSRVPPG